MYYQTDPSIILSSYIIKLILKFLTDFKFDHNVDIAKFKKKFTFVEKIIRYFYIF